MAQRANVEATRVTVEGANLPLKMPVSRYAELSADLPAAVLEALQAAGAPPTPLQQYTLPVHLAGRDLAVEGARSSEQLACLMTATVAGTLLSRGAPCAREAAGCAPRALVLVPTREHARMAEAEAASLASATGVCSALVYGAQPIERSLEEIGRDVELLIATPTRLLDLTERGVLQLGAIKFLVLIAADVLLDFGFAPHLQQLMENESLAPAPERQTALTCASMTIALKALLPRLLRPTHVKITGAQPWRAACTAPLVTQQAVFADERSKQQALASVLDDERHNKGLCLVFVATRRQCETLQFYLQEEGYRVASMSGERLKSKERDATIHAFTSGHKPILIATDSALRNVALPHVHSVVSYDIAPTVEAYVQRVAFTGRAGHSGIATTLVSESASVDDARRLVAVLREADAPVPRWLEALVVLRPSSSSFT